MRREFRRRLEQPRQHGGFRQVHVARRFVEIILRGRVHPEGAAAEIGAIEVEFQDLVLRQPHLQPQRQERLLDLALDGALVGEEQVLGELLGDRGAALHHAAGARIGEHRAHGTGNIDAEMLVEPPILGGQYRLDQVVGELVERHRIVVADAARADLGAVAVEEGDRELGFLEPVVVRGLTEGRDRERQHQQQPAGAERQPLRDRLDHDPAPPAGDVEAVHDGGEALVQLAPPGARLVDAEIDARVEIEQDAAGARPPGFRIAAFAKEIAHLFPSRGSNVGTAKPAAGAAGSGPRPPKPNRGRNRAPTVVKLLSHPLVPHYGCGITR